MKWHPIAIAPTQSEVLVCNAAYLGWHCVAILNAANEWREAGSLYRAHRLKYLPTHWMWLPSIQILCVDQVGRA